MVFVNVHILEENKLRHKAQSQYRVDMKKETLLTKRNKIIYRHSDWIFFFLVNHSLGYREKDTIRKKSMSLDHLV